MTANGRSHPSLPFGLRRILDPKPAWPLVGFTRHRSRSPADGCPFIVLDLGAPEIGQKVTSINQAGSFALSGDRDGRRGIPPRYGHSKTPFAQRSLGADRGSGIRHTGRPRAVARPVHASRPEEGSPPDSLHVFPFSPPTEGRWEIATIAISAARPTPESPVALRPPLTRGLPFRLLSIPDAGRFPGPSQCVVAGFPRYHRLATGAQWEAPGIALGRGRGASGRRRGPARPKATPGFSSLASTFSAGPHPRFRGRTRRTKSCGAIGIGWAAH
jgi:hypothetical protein